MKLIIIALRPLRACLAWTRWMLIERAEEEHVFGMEKRKNLHEIPLMSFYFPCSRAPEAAFDFEALIENLYGSCNIAHLSIKHLIKWYFCISRHAIGIAISVSRLSRHIKKRASILTAAWKTVVDLTTANIMWPYHMRKLVILNVRGLFPSRAVH